MKRRAKQQLPAEIVADVQSAIRNQFYGDAFERWPKDQHFIKREFTLYLASWLDKRGVTLQPHKYKQLLLDPTAESQRLLPAPQSRNRPSPASVLVRK